jgi:enoyl-CoA hydratase/carnithine racemase
MSGINVETNNNITTIFLQNGKVNAISHEVIDGINAALDMAEEQGNVVILTGQPGMFSGGFDLNTMKSGPDAAIELVTKGSKLSRRMLSFPFPIIGACSGHAIAKGAFLLLSCDYRIGCAGEFKIGLNEVAIGMTMHHAGIEIARNRIPVNFFNRSVINAEIFSPHDAIDAGFLDLNVEPEKLMSTAIFTAQQMAKLDMKAHHATKIKAKEAFLNTLDESIQADLSATLTFN